MLANAPDVDGSAMTNRPLPEQPSKGNAPGEGSVGLPVRRVGLEQESFLVDRTGELCDLADHFLRRCWEAAEEVGRQGYYVSPGKEVLRCSARNASKQHAKPPAEPVEEPRRRYYLQSIDTKFISGAPDSLRACRPLSSELACAQNRPA
jgi:hypothetical protein